MQLLKKKIKILTDFGWYPLYSELAAWCSYFTIYFWFIYVLLMSTFKDVCHLRSFLLCWKSGSSALLEIRSLCIGKRLGTISDSFCFVGSQVLLHLKKTWRVPRKKKNRKHKMLIPLTGLVIDLSSSQTRTLLCKKKLPKRHEILKIFLWIFSG